jgi:hypothetical protein
MQCCQQLVCGGAAVRNQALRDPREPEASSGLLGLERLLTITQLSFLARIPAFQDVHSDVALALGRAIWALPHLQVLHVPRGFVDGKSGTLAQAWAPALRELSCCLQLLCESCRRQHLWQSRRRCATELARHHFAGAQPLSGGSGYSLTAC